MAIQLSSETKEVNRERRTRCITIDCQETGPRISVQRQEVLRDANGVIIGRGDFTTFSFGVERMTTAARIALMQDIADTVDAIEQEIADDQ